MTPANQMRLFLFLIFVFATMFFITACTSMIPAKRGWFTWYCPVGYALVQPASDHDIPACEKV